MTMQEKFEKNQAEGLFELDTINYDAIFEFIGRAEIESKIETAEDIRYNFMVKDKKRGQVVPWDLLKKYIARLKEQLHEHKAKD